MSKLQTFTFIRTLRFNAIDEEDAWEKLQEHLWEEAKWGCDGPLSDFWGIDPLDTEEDI